MFNDLQGKDEVPSGTVEISVGDNTQYILVTSYDGSAKTYYTVTVRRRPMYNVTINHNNGTDDTTVADYEEDSLIIVPEIEYTGYTVSGWLNGEDDWSINEDTVQNAMVLDAVWTANGYNVTFNSVGGSKVSERTVAYDSSYTLPVPSKIGYSFVGWKYGSAMLTNANGVSLSNWKINNDAEVFAVWKIINYDISYKNTKGANNDNANTYNVETAVMIVPISQDGYTFNNWTDEDGEIITSINVGNVGNRTITANWTLITYVATFKADGVTQGTAEFTVESESVTEPDIPDKVGYTKAWAEYDFIASNITVNAVYTPIIYDVTYINAGTHNNAVTYTIETPTITFADATKDGYTFDNWTEGGKVVTGIELGSYGDKTITANWTLITYSLTMVMENEEGTYDGHYAGEENRTSYNVENEFTFVEPVCDILGYEFKGWYTTKNDGDKVTGINLGTIGNKTYYAQWRRSEYNISYYYIDNADNSNPSSYNVESDAFSLNTPAKIGYDFLGWYSNEALTVTADTTIETGSIGALNFYAKWQLSVYTIIYVMYDGENSADNPANYTIETADITLSMPTKADYSFGGWFTDSTFETDITAIVSGSTGNKTLYARWYWIATVTFDSNGGSAVAPIKQEYATALSAPTAPTRDYYTFVGWYGEEALTTVYAFTTMPCVDFTLYAKWTPIEYTITYVLNGGTNAKENPTKYTTETELTFNEPTKTGYSFVAWYTDASFTSAVVEEIASGSHGGIILYANFSINKYTLTFDSNGGSAVTAITQEYNTTVVAPAEPSLTGYRFEGWYTEGNKLYVFNKIEANDIALKAKWSLIEYVIEYNLDGGTNDTQNPKKYTINTSKISLKAPSKRGYTFGGWFTDSTFNTAVTEIGGGAYGDVGVQAKWTIIPYSINYVGAYDSANENPDTYTVEDAIIFKNIDKKGYTFNGLFNEGTFSTKTEGIEQGSIGNVTLYASYTANSYTVWMDGKQEASYTVSFDLNGASGSIASQMVTASTALAYPNIPSRANYIFAGWYTENECSGTAFDFSAEVNVSRVLYAKWLALTGTIMTVGTSKTITIDGTALLSYTFVPLVSGNVSITTTGEIDTFGYLYSADGTLLKSNDDGNDGSNFLIKYNVTAGEKYVIKVRGYGKATSGTATLYLSGSNTVSDGGYAVVTGGKVTATFDAAFTLTVPAKRDGYVFRGYEDIDGVKYVGEDGNSIINFDKDEETVLYSIWEVDGFDVTFVTNGGSAIATVTLPSGSRLDINQYVTTKSGYSFVGWYLSASDSESYNASVMPDNDITLYAKWTSYVLNAVKYDESITSVSEHVEITADTFGATCFDSDGVMVDLVVAIGGTQTAGNSITVRYTATKNGKAKTATIQNVAVYDYPSLTIGVNKDYINLKDGLAPTWFSATATDTYGVSLTPVVSLDGVYKAGDTVTVKITATDVAGNSTVKTVENIKLYGLPTISYNTSLAGMSVFYDDTSPALQATAVDSFGVALAVKTAYIGTLKAGTATTVTFTATDIKGNVSTLVVKNVKVYGTPTINAATKTDFKVEDIITVSTLGLTAKDTYNGAATVGIAVKSGTQTAGTGMTYTVTATDAVGNVTTNTVTIKIYGAITLVVNKANISTDTDVTPKGLSATATDSFRKELELTVNWAGGSFVGGQTVTYSFTAVDNAGNTLNENKIFVVYAQSDIVLTYEAFSSDKIKITSTGEEFSASATDTYGAACIITVEASGGGALVGGKAQSVVIVATDKAGNRRLSEVIANIKVYDKPTLTYAHEYLYITAADDIDFMFTAHDSFTEELAAVVTTVSSTPDLLTVSVSATDDAGNNTTTQYTITVLSSGESYLALFVDEEQVGSQTVTVGNSYTLPTEFLGYTFNCWKLKGVAITDGNGKSLSNWPEDDGVYRVDLSKTLNKYNVTYILKGGVNSTDNPASFTVLTLGGAEKEIALSAASKVTKEEIKSSVSQGDGTYLNTIEVTQYTFLGWYSDSAYNTEVTALSLAVGAVSLYARWSETTTTTTAYQRVNASGEASASGSYIYFGSYPQTKVTDTATITALGTYASNRWASYGYYISGSTSSFMNYTDKTYNGDTYRGVYFTSYRPYSCGNSSSTGSSYQDDNGYYTSTVYWFKYEPILWRILTESNGTAKILCETAIDSQQYDFDGSYSNNYANSTIRAWLNDTFYNTSFSALQKELIQTTVVYNSVASTGYSSNQYACANTSDKIFLLSYAEVVNSSYGFSSDTARQKKSSDYAKSQGCWASTGSGYVGNCWWWLRSPYDSGSDLARDVSYDGVVYYGGNVYRTDEGVVPALTISLS